MSEDKDINNKTVNEETSVIHTVKEEEKKPEVKEEEPAEKKKKRFFTINVIIGIVLCAAIVLFGLSMYAYKNRDTIRKQAKQQAIDSSADDQPASTALPSELTTLGSNLIFVNKSHSLPADYVPANLTTPYLNSTTDAIQLTEEAGNQAKAMKDAAASDGINLIVSSGYRSYSEQDAYYQSRVNLLGKEAANTDCAQAGMSEHQTGLAIDFTDDPTNSNSHSVSFADTDAGKWLYEHAHEYGFILRYPKGKESITGYNYMPWHYRYVGTDTANAMYAISPDETFEEYFNIK
ncbi:MAG: M15 family metallopeptidase [Erysipelotrichaceae bacterium]|nr:M15 family metallopeptidase [Erysipelotrichaceae bacterium]